MKMGYDSANGYVGIARQTVKGTGVAPSTFVRFLTAASQPVNEVQEFREGGNDRTGAKMEKVGMIFALMLEAYARADLAGLLFCMALGADAISGAGPYDHVITPGALDWWTVEMQKVGGLTPNEIVDRLEDSKLSSLVFSGVAGDMLRLSIEGQGLIVDSSNAAASDTYGTEAIMKFLEGTYTMFGGVTTEITAFTLSLANNLEAVQTNALTYQQAVELALDVNLDFTLKVTQDDEFRKVYYGASDGTAASEDLEKSAIDITINNGLLTTAEREIKVAIPELSYQIANLTDLNADAEVVYLECSGKATKLAGQELITVTVKNNDAAAYDGA